MNLSSTHASESVRAYYNQLSAIDLTNFQALDLDLLHIAVSQHQYFSISAVFRPLDVASYAQFAEIVLTRS